VVPLAAVVLGASFFIVFVVGSGFAKAVMPMVATALGQGDEVQVRRDTRMGLWLSIGYGIAVCPIFWWSEAILLGPWRRSPRSRPSRRIICGSPGLGWCRR
jgi:MATE family multidrug resistance protein